MFRNILSPRGTIVPVAGQRQYARLVSSVQSHVIFLTIRATLTITAGGTSIRNNGSVLGAFDFFGVEENGRDTHLYDARTLGFISELALTSPRSATRLTSVAIATTNLVEQVAIWFAHPFAVNSRETAYLERDPKALLQVFAQLRADGGLPAILNGGTATLTNITVDVDHEFDPAASGWPQFMPMARQYTEQIAATNAAYQSYIKSPNYLRGLVIQQDSNIGEVSDIINKVTLRSDSRDLIGPAGMKWNNLSRSLEQRHGGSMSNQSYGAIWFQRQGRLASLLNAATEPNLRLELDSQASVTAGVTSSIVRVTLLEMVRDLWTDPQTGRRVVSPNLNIPGI